ncbi:hypothetical protein, partial [Tabrizicola sp.]|uniref:hypothetical protein n=1 Tax=Tabrizicola sp. TaxID=2005166 RepID=UPI003F3E1A27
SEEGRAAREYLEKSKCACSFFKYSGELEGQRPSSAEEEGASPDDETRSLRASALNLKTVRRPYCG